MSRLFYRVSSFGLALLTILSCALHVVALDYLVQHRLLSGSILEWCLTLFDIIAISFFFVIISHVIWPDKSWKSLSCHELFPSLLLIGDLGSILTMLVWGWTYNSRYYHETHLVQLFFQLNLFAIVFNCFQLIMLWCLLRTPKTGTQEESCPPSLPIKILH